MAGSQFNFTGQLNGFPRIPIEVGIVTTGGIITLVTTALVPLLKAVLGGITRMRFHFKADRVGINHQASLQP